MTWTERPFLAIDTETTGVDCFTDRIVELASAVVDPDGSVRDGWSTIVDPGVDIPDEAAAVHGITTERARSEGVSPAEAVRRVAGDIWAHQGTFAPEGAPVVMFNARFDWPLLMTEAERYGVEFPCFAPILDPYLIDRMCDRYRKGRRQLTLVADHYGIDLGESAHGALADATAAGQVMRQILDRYPAIGEHTLAGVWLRQVRGHEEDRQRFVDYMRRNTDPEFDSPPGWPVPAGVNR